MRKLENKINTSFNTNSLSQNKSPRHIPKAYKQIAEGMERQFINHLINEMDKSINLNKPRNSAEEYYHGLQKSEFADILTKKDNIGIQKVILDQIYPDNNRNNRASEHLAQLSKIKPPNMNNLRFYNMEKDNE